MNTREKILG